MDWKYNNTTRPMEGNVPKQLPNDEIEVIGSSVVYTLLSATIVCGNGLIIAAYQRNNRLRTATNTFLVGLAISDLLVGLVSVPLWVYFSVCQQYNTCDKDPNINVFYATVDIFAGCASVLQLTGMSIERFMAITRPIVHRTFSSKFYTTLIVMAWFYAFVMAVFFPIQQGKWEKPYTIILVSTCFAIPTTVIFIVYVMIFKTALFSSREVRVSPESNHTRSLQQEAKIAVTIAVITSLFVIAWLPFFVLNVIATFSPEYFPRFPEILRLIRFVKWMHYSNSVVNPVIYAYRNREMRREFVKIVRRVLFCCCCMKEGMEPRDFHTRTQVSKSAFKLSKKSAHSDENKDIENKNEMRSQIKKPSCQSNVNHSTLPREEEVCRSFDGSPVMTFQGIDTICSSENVL